MSRRKTATFVLAALVGALALTWGIDPTVFGLLPPEDRGEAAAGSGAPIDGEAQLRAEARGEAGRLVGFPGLHLARRGTGVVVGTVRLLVPGAGEQPLAGAEIDLLSVDGEGKEGAETRVEGTSDGDGSFTLAPVPARAGWVLRAKHPPHRDLFLRGIAVHDGRTTDVGALVFGATTTLEGLVTDAAGRPLRGAQVAVLRGGAAGAGIDIARALRDLASSSGPILAGATEGDGRFALKGLPPGRYSLRVTYPGYAAAFVQGVFVTADGESGEVRVVLDEGAGFFGRVLDESGRGIGDARVVAVALKGERMESVDRQETASAADGRYRLDTLTPGVLYFVEAHRDGWAPMGRLLPAAPGVAPLDLTLVPGGRIEGRITDAKTGRPVPGAEILAVTGLMGSGTAPVATVADDAGAYALENVIPGPVAMLEVRAQGYGPGGFGYDPREKGRTVRAGETLVADVALDHGGRILGSVRTEGGAPVPYASVAAAQERNRWAGETVSLTDGKGEFVLLGLKPARYVLAVTAPGYASPTSDAEVKVDVTADAQDVTRDFVLKPGATVAGVVRTPESEPVAGARVTVVPADSRGLGSRVRDLAAVCDADGAYRVVGLPTGIDLVLEATHDAWVRTPSAPFKAAPGEARTLDVVLRRGARVVGRAVDAASRPVAGARVRYGHVNPGDEGRLKDSFRADELLSPRVFVADAAGGFALDRVEPGPAILKVEADGFAAWYRKDLSVPAEGDVTGIEARLEGATTIRGRVLAADTGEGIAGGWVYAQWRQPEGEKDDGRVRTLVSAETGAGGAYVLEKVPPGALDVVVWFAAGFVTGWNDPTCRRDSTPAGSTGVDFRLVRVPPAQPGGN